MPYTLESTSRVYLKPHLHKDDKVQRPALSGLGARRVCLPVRATKASAEAEKEGRGHSLGRGGGRTRQVLETAAHQKPHQGPKAGFIFGQKNSQIAVLFGTPNLQLL